MILTEGEHAASRFQPRLHEELLYSKALERDVSVSVLLPPGHDPAGGPYPVLYLNDGQDLPRLRLPETLEALYAQQAIQPFVLVAPHANENRLHEYGVAAQADYNGRGDRAAEYTAFVLNELLPFAETTYHASANPAAAVMAGFSLGGLSAFDVVWHHPQRVARAGVFSGSFWWRSRAIGAGYTPADRIMLAQVRAGQFHPSHRFWLQTGTLDERNDRNENGVIDAVEDCLDLLDELVRQGLDPAETVRYVQVDGGRHHPDTWGQVMPDFLRWAFGMATGTAAQPAPLPMVRLQLDPRLAPAVLPATVPPLVLPAPPPATATLPPAAHHKADDPLPTSPPMTVSPTVLRPADDDFLPSYAGYVSLIPAGTDPLQALREQPREIRAAFASLTEEQALTTYAPGKWTPKQILLHVVDAERVFAYRALRFARGDAQPLAGFDENEYANLGGANERTMSSLLAEYDAVRAATIALFGAFTEQQLSQHGVANNAPMTVRALLFITTGHERHHLNVFEERYRPVL